MIRANTQNIREDLTGKLMTGKVVMGLCTGSEILGLLVCLREIQQHHLKKHVDYWNLIECPGQINENNPFCPSFNRPLGQQYTWVKTNYIFGKYSFKILSQLDSLGASAQT